MAPLSGALFATVLPILVASAAGVSVVSVVAAIVLSCASMAGSGSGLFVGLVGVLGLEAEFAGVVAPLLGALFATLLPLLVAGAAGV